MANKIIKAQAKGRNGEIDFDIKVTNNHIDDIEVTKSSETPAIFNQAFGKIKNNILKNQSFDVDVVSGASMMTQAMLDSGKQALENEGIHTEARVQPEHKEITIDADVAVIGTGMAGLMAASRALSMGKKVVVLEKNGYIGGATTLNGSNVVGTGSKVSAELFGEEAKKDSPTRLVKDITRECRGTNYPMLSNLLANNIGKAVDFITQFANLTYQKAETQTIEH
nr:FAD-binding protein [Lactobacillus amylovorus]